MAQQLVLRVTGMTCGGCENAVKKTVSRLSGVETVSASHANNAVEVGYDPAQVTPQAISDAILKLGYQVVP